MTTRDQLRLWFSFREPIDRRAYLLSGAGLMGFKYAVDALFVAGLTGRLWSPVDYLIPLWTARQQLLAEGPGWLAPALVLFALPFLWIGVSMSARRAVDAGRSPWLALLFFLPFVNYVLIAVLAALPSRSMPPSDAPLGIVPEPLRSAMAGVAVAIANTLLTVLIGVYFRRTYSAGLFLGLPFTMGYVSAYLHSRRAPDALRGSIMMALISVTMAGGALILFALEGIVCTAMALPIAWAVAIPGALLGRAMALRSVSGAAGPGLSTVALLAPLVVAVEPRLVAPPRTVVTAIEIDTPPENVWRHVVSFPPLPPADDWLFRVGVAAPIAARIEGAGVGAVRYCDFTTGRFVEPVTSWEPGRLLAFDISSQAPPLKELSPYGTIHPPHMDGYFRATHGEFRLSQLPDGRTRLIGTTRYRVDMFPQVYWNIWADRIVQAIHLRVLRHVKRLAETALPASPAYPSLDTDTQGNLRP